jgi:RNA polymerase sigma-70 factor (ECF subfamily)
MRLTGDRHRAEDLTQETFLRAWKRRQQLKHSHAARVWLFRIAANVWRDELRQRRSPRAKLFSLPDDAIGSQPTPDQSAETRESLADALKLLDDLPIRQRTVLYLVAVEALSLNEVGDILGIDTNTVKVNLSLARKRMREQLARKALDSGLRSGTTSGDE